jgi:hypothetical protein
MKYRLLREVYLYVTATKGFNARQIAVYVPNNWIKKLLQYRNLILSVSIPLCLVNVCSFLIFSQHNK